MGATEGNTQLNGNAIFVFKLLCITCIFHRIFIIIIYHHFYNNILRTDISSFTSI
jgi:hypothetical protein